MVNELKQSFVDHVKGILWMDDITKKVTIEKTEEMITFIGYPNWLFEQGKLDEYYADVRKLFAILSIGILSILLY